jgi:hypothetical protein
MSAEWIQELCPEIADWQIELIAEHIEQRVASEREACARMVDHILKEGGGTYGKAIRARGDNSNDFVLRSVE